MDSMLVSAFYSALILNGCSGYSSVKAGLACVGLLCVLGGLEALLILTLRIPYNNGVHWPDLLVGVIATIMLGAGFVPAYPELWKRNGRVVGFSGFLRSGLQGDGSANKQQTGSSCAWILWGDCFLSSRLVWSFR